MTTVLRIGMAALALGMLVVGAWNQFWPESFYTDFPGADGAPPFSEHYARDFGGASLGLGIILAIAVAMPRTVLVVPALLGTTAFAVPHAIFHLAHLHGLSDGDLVFTVVATGLEAIAGPVLLVLAWVRHARERRATPSTR